MSEQNQTENTEASTEKAPRPEIIRGRMPVAVVALARFGSPKDLSTREAANALGTTVGKIDDIRKNRNFSYVTADFRPTEQQKADALAWLDKHPSGVNADLRAELANTDVATEEQAAAFESARSSARGQNAKTADGAEADAGGGNRRKAKGAGKKGAEQPSADNLMA
jgi:hypothetical protein